MLKQKSPEVTVTVNHKVDVDNCFQPMRFNAAHRSVSCVFRSPCNCGFHGTTIDVNLRLRPKEDNANNKSLNWKRNGQFDI